MHDKEIESECPEFSKNTLGYPDNRECSYLRIVVLGN